MSPAPQGNLEVERYIGRCLISQRVSSNNSVKPQSNCGRSFQPKGKPCENNVENRNRGYVKHHSLNQRNACDVNHVGGPSRFSLPPGTLPMSSDCNGYANGHYGHHHRQHPNGGNTPGGWTGLPLISMATGNSRRGKKVPQQMVYQTNNHRQAKSHQQCNINNGNDLESHDHDTTRSPLTKLAIHTQGAPLIQAGRYNNHNRNRGNYNRDSCLRLYPSGGDVRKADVAKNSKTNVGNQNKDTSSRNSDSLSVASDESSGNSENSLPRIIKPRKRRKKDRKPLVNQTVSNGVTSPSPPVVESNNDVSPVVTLKPYMPLCFESFGARTTSVHEPQDHETSVKSSSNNDKPVEDLINKPNSADDFPFGNLLDDEEDTRSDLTSCAPATLCQCRYCDPSGVIWDVDQRCYSPYLTPPSPTGNRFQLSNSIPVSYDTSNQNRYYTQQTLSPTFFPYSFEGDLGSVLRRSWSDPSPNMNYDLQKTNRTSSVTTAPPSPQGLQVSSEIVTSPNGHRDIEIKFYSLATPPRSSKSPCRGQTESCDDIGNDEYLSAVDKEVYDRLLFVSEE